VGVREDLLSMPSLSWTVPAVAESVPRVRESVVDFLRERGVPDASVEDVRLAVSEAVTNAVVHAFRARAEPGIVVVTASVSEGACVDVRVTDDGDGLAPRDDSPGPGLGLPLIDRLADRVEVRTPSGGVGTELSMRFGSAVR
jgi:serine/threonine-protein kinase RsbW/stage II sporulation protein AB (anti-sigma F factor)